MRFQCPGVRKDIRNKDSPKYKVHKQSKNSDKELTDVCLRGVMVRIAYAGLQP